MGGLQELIEVVKGSSDDFAENLGPEGDWAPMLFIDTAGGLVVAVIGPELTDDKDRLWNAVLPNVIHKLTENDAPRAVVMLASSWMVQLEEGEEYDPDDAVMPSEHPGRIECLMLVGVSSQEEAGAMAKIVRGGPHPELEWEPTMDGASISGAMVAGIRQAVWS